MSYYRRACIDYHSGTFLNLFTNVKNITKLDSLPTSTTSKGRHASHFFNKSSIKTKKHVFSKWQGTSYNVKYVHYGHKLIENTDICEMYFKWLSNLRHNTLIKSTSFSKQHERFERHCRNTFNHDKSHLANADQVNDRLAAANQKKFLFFYLQHINSPIKHLKYKENNPRRENYSFPISIHSTKINRLDDSSTQKVDPSLPVVKHEHWYLPLHQHILIIQIRPTHGIDILYQCSKNIMNIMLLCINLNIVVKCLIMYAILTPGILFTTNVFFWCRHFFSCKFWFSSNSPVQHELEDFHPHTPGHSRTFKK